MNGSKVPRGINLKITAQRNQVYLHFLVVRHNILQHCELVVHAFFDARQATGFLVVGLLVTGFLVVGVLVTGFLVVGLLVTGFLVVGFAVTGFLVTGFAVGFEETGMMGCAVPATVTTNVIDAEEAPIWLIEMPVSRMIPPL